MESGNHTTCSKELWPVVHHLIIGRLAPEPGSRRSQQALLDRFSTVALLLNAADGSVIHYRYCVNVFVSFAALFVFMLAVMIAVAVVLSRRRSVMMVEYQDATRGS